MTYCAELDDLDFVIRVIIGNAVWANSYLGGRWVDCERIGAGYQYINGTFIPPMQEQVDGDS